MLRIAAIILSAATAALAGFQFNGYVSDVAPKHVIVVQSDSDLGRLWLTVPARSAIGVTVAGPGAETRSFRLKLASSVDLKGAGKFTVTIAADSGAGDWGCRSVSGSLSLAEVQSYADLKHHPRIGFDTGEDEAGWKFSYPKDATFLVRRLGPGNKVLEEQDLADDASMKVYGAGTYLLEVVPTEGGGEFTATRE